MAQPTPTRLHIDPPIEQWQVTPRNGRATPVIATGHQPTLWHPGILAKYLAADAIAKRVGGSTVDVIVGHNPVPSHQLDIPRVIDGLLSVRRCELSKNQADRALPPGVAQPIDAKRASDALEQEASFASADAPFVFDGLRDLAEAFDVAGDSQPNHALQMAAVLDHLRRPSMQQSTTHLTTSALVTQVFLDRLLSDPVGCARCYNRAAAVYPEAGIPRLYVGRDVVETPLWAQDRGACTPVYADLGDSKKPQLFTQGQDLDLAGSDVLRYLRPRAITLSAIMRSELCDLFIHGTGGGVYDQVTERWWQDWTGEELAPKAVVSADLYLPFEVPVATPQRHIQAQWFAHHLRHNVDRYTEAAGEHETQLRNEKRDLLDRMNDDRLKRRRAAAFQRIHAINRELAAMHSVSLTLARQHAEDARVGVANAILANRRDWCFALYPDAVLQGLSEQINARLIPSP